MDYIALQKYLLTSPKKLREIVPAIKKLSPAEAVERLPFIGKDAAKPLGKVINVAIANARQRGANESLLIFKSIEINEGPRLKRFRAGARGRAKPYKKRQSHIRIVLTTKPEKVVKETTAKKSVVVKKGEIKSGTKS